MAEGLEVELDLQATAKAFEETWRNVSWSKLGVFRKCPTSWFFENYAVPLDRMASVDDSLLAIPGTITQRVWESVINDRVYRRFPNDVDLHAWIRQQVFALFHTMVFPLEEQWKDEGRNWRTFFRTKEGKARVQQMQRDVGLDPLFYKGFQPKFTDPAKFLEKHGSIEKFVDKYAGQFPPMLAKFREMGVDFDRLLSEQFISAKFGDFELRGNVDFLYNLFGNGQFDKMEDLRKDFIILDGKATVHENTSEGQLHFYATAISMKYRRTPSAVGFIDWSKADFVWKPFSLDDIEAMRRSISVLQAHASQIASALSGAAATRAYVCKVSEVPFLKLNPSRTNCMFCRMKTRCSAAVELGYDGTKKPEGYIPPSKVPEGLDPGQHTDEVTF